MVVETKADLTSSFQWDQGDGNVWLYDGAIVTVTKDPEPLNNGIYYLSSSVNYETSSNWIKSGTGTGFGNSLLRYGEIYVSDIAGDCNYNAASASGDFTASFSTDSLLDNVKIECDFYTPLDDTDYNVLVEIISLQDTNLVNFDRTIIQHVIRNKTTNGFELHLTETGQFVQDIQANVRIESTVKGGGDGGGIISPGTSSYALSSSYAETASFAEVSISSSYAETASYVETRFIH